MNIFLYTIKSKHLVKQNNNMKNKKCVHEMALEKLTFSFILVISEVASLKWIT